MSVYVTISILRTRNTVKWKEFGNNYSRQKRFTKEQAILWVTPVTPPSNDRGSRVSLGILPPSRVCPLAHLNRRERPKSNLCSGSSRLSNWSSSLLRVPLQRSEIGEIYRHNFWKVFSLSISPRCA